MLYWNATRLGSCLWATVITSGSWSLSINSRPSGAKQEWESQYPIFSCQLTTGFIFILLYGLILNTLNEFICIGLISKLVKSTIGFSVVLFVVSPQIPFSSKTNDSLLPDIKSEFYSNLSEWYTGLYFGWITGCAYVLAVWFVCALLYLALSYIPCYVSVKKEISQSGITPAATVAASTSITGNPLCQWLWPTFWPGFETCLAKHDL